MQVLQAGPHKLILLEIDADAVTEVAEQAGFETRTKDSPGNIVLDITATQRETGVAVCGGSAVQPLAGRTEAPGVRN
jgi:hypothetical protein